MMAVRILELWLVTVSLIHAVRGSTVPLGLCDNFVVTTSDFMQNCAPYLPAADVDQMYRDCQNYVENDPAAIHDFLDAVKLRCESAGHSIELPGGCASRPCQNGGYCVQYNDVSFECRCVSPYTGVFCQDGPNGYRYFEGYKLVDILPKTRGQVRYLGKLAYNDRKHQLSFWEFPSRVGENVRIMMSPKQFDRYSQKFDNKGLCWEVVDRNVTEVARTERERFIKRLTNGVGFFDVYEFNPFEEICEWLTDAVLTKCPAGVKCFLTTIGTSHEGEDIKMFSMSTDTNFRPDITQNKPAMYIDSLHHAREWLGGSTVLCMIYYLLKHYGSDPGVTYMINTYNWYIVPVVNPDGYKFTWTDDRCWRKNRKPINQACTGVDLNRNYDFEWNTNGVNSNPCNDLYPGAGPNSETEVQAIAARLCTIAPQLYAMVTVHTYGNMFMHPWSNTVDPNNNNAACNIAADAGEMFPVVEAAGMAIEARYSTNWDWGNSCDVLYAMSGTTNDYAKDTCNIKYAFLAELRGNDFTVNEDQIPLAFHEFWDGILAMETEILSNPPF